MGSFFSQEQEQRRMLMERVFRDHWTSVRRFISRQVRQPDVVDDLTSLVFLKAYRWLLEDRGRGQVRTWLYATARTTIADYWQEQQKRATLSLENIEDHVAVPVEQQDDEQAQAWVQRLLQTLPAREQEVLFLRYLQGYTAAEVGQQLGMSAGHVRVVQLRALRHAAALLQAEERTFSPVYEPVTTYSQTGQRVLDLAKEEALFFQHLSIGAEHLLLGILREGSVAAPLIEQGMSLERIRAGIFFLRGKGQPDSDADPPFNPHAKNILARADREARNRGEMTISPEQILYALQTEEYGYGITQGPLQFLGVGRLKVTKPPVEESENEHVLRQMEQRVAQHPALSLEEEQRLAHLVARGNLEKRRAERLQEVPDPRLVEEGQSAYFRLVYACQHLVLSVAQEYFAPGRDYRAIINAGNIALTYALCRYDMKTHVPFRTYAAHCMHLEIIEGVLEHYESNDLSGQGEESLI